MSINQITLRDGRVVEFKQKITARDVLEGKKAANTGEEIEFAAAMASRLCKVDNKAMPMEFYLDDLDLSEFSKISQALIPLLQGEKE